MSQVFSLKFRQGCGSIVGTYISLNVNDKLESLSLYLGKNSNQTSHASTNGRFVTAAYWVVDKDFDRATLKLDMNKAIYCEKIISKSGLSGSVWDLNGISYANTNVITENIFEEFKFEFNSNSINSNKIFFALISTPDSSGDNTVDLYDVNNSSLTIGATSGGSYYYRKSGSINSSNSLTRINSTSIYFSEKRIKTITDSDDNYGTSTKPSKILCSDIRYRTWSQQTDESKNGWDDGGENYVENSNHCIRKDNQIFNADFDISEGKLKDIVFDNPHLEAYNNGNVNLPRWVFKRSRIKFTIPPVRNSNDQIQKTAVQIRYKVEAAIHDNAAYRNQYVSKSFELTESIRDITIMICPRDEGVLDNTEFRITFERRYKNGSTWSDPSTYYFRTYQKPTVSIAYPKIIRNKTISNNTDSGFQNAKILTNNLYSNFSGNSAIVSKHVCDALTVLTATSEPDASGIPMFIRYYVAEYKFGRNGCLNDDGKSVNESKFKTLQDLYKSNNKNDYTSLDDILNGTALPTAYFTSINVCDGSPILLSGRLTDQNIKELITSEEGQKLKLWIHRNWDYVVNDDKDVKVGNTWPIFSTEHDIDGDEIRYYKNNHARVDKNSTDYGKTNKTYSKQVLLTPSIVGDHAGPSEVTSYYRDYYPKTIRQTKSTALLFRAGYVYLIKMRVFHGAAAGAIGAKYGEKNRTIYGFGGEYDYTTSENYKGQYPYILNANGDKILDDVSYYGKEYPYRPEFTPGNYGSLWVGPDDGTSGLSLNDSNVNKTYPGFSEADYSTFETICPYTSNNNLITTHPTSGQISVNQWVTFNYRHVSKNIGDIDSYVTVTNDDNTTTTFPSSFGKKDTGISNTITRMMHMHTSAVETILHHWTYAIHGDNTEAVVSNGVYNNEYDNDCKRNPAMYASLWLNHNCNNETDGVDSYNRPIYKYPPLIIEEKVTLWNVPISKRSTVDENGYKYIETFYSDDQVNIINEHSMGATAYDIANDAFYYSGDNEKNIPETGLCRFNRYRSYLFGNSSTYDPKNPKYTINDDEDIRYKWSEYNVVLRTFDTAHASSDENNRTALIEPLGNVYRWQPVINAMSYEYNENGAVKISEIEIEGKYNEIVVDNSCNINNENSFSSIKIERKYMELDADSKPNKEFDIQNKYFYMDNNTYQQYMSNCNIASENDNSDDVFKRFTINEFAGVTTGTANGSPGGAVMYTTVAKNKGPYSSYDNFSRFFANHDGSFKEDEKAYGKLFTRVPSAQDCENGVRAHMGTSYVISTNLNGISIKNNDNQIMLDDQITDKNGNLLNAIPFVRTTHYLYFKTWINTTYSMKVEVRFKPVKNIEFKLDEDGKEIGEPSIEYGIEQKGILYFNGNKMVAETDDDKLIYFGTNDKNDNIIRGLSQVYGEDNGGWGRCLSAEDNSSRAIGEDGTILSNPTSGGLEVPILVRYTPLLQPKIASEIANNTVLQTGCKMITVKLKKNSGSNNWNNRKVYASFLNGVNFSESILQEIEGYDLNIYYPFISENNTYYTVSPNGGLSGYLYYDGYNIDVDTDPSKTIDNSIQSTDATNLDFLGGYGICTSYIILLVPSDPNLNDLTKETNPESKFQNKDKHWNYYKQPANYYLTDDIFKVRSKSITDAGPVLVAYRVKGNKVGEYLQDAPLLNTNWKVNDTTIKGRCQCSVNINFKNLLEGKVINPENYTLTHYKLTDDNTLKSGLKYDLVIVPVYDNKADSSYNYKSELAGTLNSKNNDSNYYGGGTEKEEIVFCGSSPYVTHDYMSVTDIKEVNNTPGGGGGGGGYDPPDPPDNEDDNRIKDYDHAIIFPNVDHKLYNHEKGVITEGPGFWLNNSFKLILRLPSFRTKNTKINSRDLNTIEHLSYGTLDSSNGDTANDFEFDDLQIHIGKISELAAYGYPDNMATQLNTITSKSGLAAAHIISYKDYCNEGVFSKKLKNNTTVTDDNDNAVDEDKRDKATGGALTPENANYKNRFIEVNLANAKIANDDGELVPIYSKYPEGYYIQFRWKSAYGSADNESQWSSWHGGSYDGGGHWWGEYGTEYFVPVRNYTDIHTDFRNYIKESYPGSLINAKNENGNITATVGKGSNSILGSTDETSNNNPQDAISPGYYHKGTGNHENSKIVPKNYQQNQSKIVIKPKKNEDSYITVYEHDNSYDPQYKTSHDINFTIPDNITNMHQNMWEMLYIDYIIRNMSKLYYKPNYNFANSNDTGRNKQYYNLCSPYIDNKPLVLSFKGVGNDGTNKGNEYNEFDHIGSNEAITSNIRKWNRNKYYRKVITKDDFDTLNEHLINLVNFTRHVSFTGEHSNNPVYGNVDVILTDANSLNFDRNQKSLIGHSIDSYPGHSDINNINHSMMSSNYIQNIWQNILSVISTEDGESTKRIGVKED